MDRLVIRGGRRLAGSAAVSGAKNEALPCMAAALMAGGPLRLEGVPAVRDAATMAALLETLGVRCRRDAGGVTLMREDAGPHAADYRLVRQMRASVCVLGPLLASRGRARVAMPGGCQIGHRPVDVHLRALAQLGADVRLERGDIVAEAPSLVGRDVDVSGPAGPTVTGTCNLMAAATAARGVTVLRRAAREPEVAAFGRCLVAMGAEIDGLGSDTVEVRGAGPLGGATHAVGGDRIEAVTLAAAAAATGGAVRITGGCRHAGAAWDWLRAIGVEVEVSGDDASVTAGGPLRSEAITAEPHPGLPTDVQAQLTAVLTRCEGSASVLDRVFPERFGHLAELARLGADVSRTAAGAVVRGPTPLAGASVMASDLRASAALVIAGLAATNETVVRRVYHLDRGYERLEEKLRGLGADVERQPDPLPY